MNKKRSKNNKIDKFEPGIYNYCDRWCEKCLRTEKCLLFHREEENRQQMIKNGLNPDEPRDAFLMVEKELSNVENQIDDLCKKLDIDISRTDDDEENERMISQRVVRSTVNKVARIFCKNLCNWLKITPALGFDDCREAIENLAWHGPLMTVKIYRSLVGKYEAILEKGKIKKECVEDSKKSACVAYRSALISLKALKSIDSKVIDPKIGDMIGQLEQIISRLNAELL